MGGNNKWVSAVDKAIQEFVEREYPNNELTEGLTVIPDLPKLDAYTTRLTYSSQGAKGGLLDQNVQSSM